MMKIHISISSILYFGFNISKALRKQLQSLLRHIQKNAWSQQVAKVTISMNEINTLMHFILQMHSELGLYEILHIVQTTWWKRCQMKANLMKL